MWSGAWEPGTGHIGQGSRCIPRLDVPHLEDVGAEGQGQLKPASPPVPSSELTGSALGPRQGSRHVPLPSQIRPPTAFPRLSNEPARHAPPTLRNPLITGFLNSPSRCLGRSVRAAALITDAEKDPSGNCGSGWLQWRSRRMPRGTWRSVPRTHALMGEMMSAPRDGAKISGCRMVGIGR